MIPRHSLPVMEELKPLRRLLDQDPRYAEMMSFGMRRRYSFRRHYKRFSLLGRPRNAPAEIVNGFVTAQYLALFAWFFFPLASTAEMQALGTLEHALRRRMSNERASGLLARLNHAKTAGWIRGDRLRKVEPYVEPVSPEEFARRPLDPEGDANLDIFIANLREQRNWLAHGNWSGGADPFMSLDIVLQLIDQLYP